MKNQTNKLEKEVLFILNLFQNSFDPGSQEVKRLFDELESFGEDVALAALKRYRFTTKSNFLSYPEIIQCVKHEMMLKENLYDSKIAWGKLQDAFEVYPSMPDNTPEILIKTINSLGGWDYLKRSENTMSDRSNFYRIYNEYLEEYLTEKLQLISGNSNG